MKRLRIKLNSIDTIKNFVLLNETMPFDIDVLSGRYMIDGKSIMGLFSLDCSKEIEAQIHADKEDGLDDYLARLKNVLDYEEM